MVIPHGPLLFLYLVPPLLQFATALLMLRRGFHRSYPIFFAFTVFSVFLSVYLMGWTFAFSRNNATMVHYYPQYFTSFWAMYGLRELLAYGILFRAFVRASEPYASLRPWASTLYGVAFCACLIVAIIGISGSPYQKNHPITAAVLSFLQSSHTVGAGIFAFILVFSIVSAVPLWDYGFGIVAGFGIQAVVLLVGMVIQHYAGPSRLGVTEYANAVGYFLATVTWLGYLVVPHKQPVSITSSEHLAMSSGQMKAWREALKEFWHR